MNLNSLGADDIEESENIEITQDGDIQLAWQGEMIPDNNTVVLYDFDEGMGDVLHDKGPNQIDGQINNPIWVEGKYDGGLLFDNKPRDNIRYNITGDLNLNPANSSNNRFEMQTPSGKIDIDTVSENGSSYSYLGAATEVKVKPKGQGKTLVINGNTIQLTPSERYTISSPSMTVNLRNTHSGGDWSQAKGHWWIQISVTDAKITPDPVPNSLWAHYVDLGNDPVLDIEYEITIEVWINPLMILDENPILTKHEAYSLELIPGSQVGYLQGGLFIDGSWRYICDSTTPINIGEWTHVAFTYDSSSMNLYLNGELVSSQSQTGNIQVNSNPVYIARNEATDAYFCGKMDELRISDRALTDFNHIWHSYYREGYFITTQFDLPTGMIWGYCQINATLLEHIYFEALDLNNVTVCTDLDLSNIDPIQNPSLKFKFTLYRYNLQTPVISNYSIEFAYSIDPWIYFDIDNTLDVVVTARSLVVEQSMIGTTTTVILDTPTEVIAHYRFEDPIGRVELTVQTNYWDNVTDIQILDLKHNDDPPQVQDENHLKYDYILTPVGGIETLSMDIANSDYNGWANTNFIERNSNIYFPDLEGPLAAQFEQAIAFGYIPTYWIYYLYQIWKDNWLMNQKGPLYCVHASPWSDSWDKDGVVDFVEMMFGTWGKPFHTTYHAKYGGDCEYPGNSQGIWDDVGIDGKPDKCEKGYGPSNKDPNKDNYNAGRGPDNITNTTDDGTGYEGNDENDGLYSHNKEMFGDGWSDYKEIYLTYTLPNVPNKRRLMLIAGGSDKDSNSPGFWNTLNYLYVNFCGGIAEGKPFSGEAMEDVDSAQAKDLVDGGVRALIFYANGVIPNDNNMSDEPFPPIAVYDDNANYKNEFEIDDNMFSSNIEHNVRETFKPNWTGQGPDYSHLCPIRKVISTERVENSTDDDNVTNNDDDDGDGCYDDKSYISYGFEAFSYSLGRTTNPAIKNVYARDFLWVMINAHGEGEGTYSPAGFSIWETDTKQKIPYNRVELERDLGYFNKVVNGVPINVNIIMMIGTCQAGDMLYGSSTANPNTLLKNDRVFMVSSKGDEKSYLCDGLDIHGRKTTGTQYPYNEDGYQKDDIWETEFFYHFIYAWYGPNLDMDPGKHPPADDLKTPTYQYGMKAVGWGNENHEVSLLEAFNFISGMESHHPMYGLYPVAKKYSTPILEDNQKSSDSGMVSMTGTTFNFVKPSSATKDGYISNHIYA
jgi:hypothetical protein